MPLCIDKPNRIGEAGRSGRHQLQMEVGRCRLWPARVSQPLCHPGLPQLGEQIGSPVGPLRRSCRWPLKRALARAGLPRDIRFHDLRHTAATLMLANGVDIPTVAAILGHSRNSIYAHAVPNNLNRAVDAIQRALRGTR